MQTRVAQLEKYVLKGTLRELAENGQKIMLGEGLRENLGLRYGDSIRFTSGIPVQLAITSATTCGVTS
jgi:ABC-type lipoprotein release transport system permease subunit